MTDANDNDGRKVSSLRELPRAVEPPRELWSEIEARIIAERGLRSSFVRRVAQTRWMAMAAVIAALAVGIWVGRSMLPWKGPVNVPTASRGSASNVTTPNKGAQAFLAAYVSDPKYHQQREELLKSLQAQLVALPPDTRAKVISSLATIHQSMQDLEAALGKDPSNALLQELLIDTYQDEMRVLTTVHEASETGKGI